jgi:hydrogenase expression/formation protein HypE
LRILLEEAAIPVRPEVRAVCEVLGLEVLSLACEGRVVAWVAGRDATTALAVMRAHPGGEHAAIIGRVAERRAGEVALVLETAAGGRRPLDLLSGSDLPRIC